MIRKGDAPVVENSQNLDWLIEIYFKFSQLKLLYRQGWLQAGVSREQCETVAEHSMGVVLLAALLGRQRKEVDGFDFEKAMLMALFHDFGEIYAGDFTPLDEISPERKHAIELDAIRRVFADVEDREYFLALWEEFEAGESIEARWVKELDRLEMGLQACVYQMGGQLKSPETFLASMMKDVSSPDLRKIAEEVRKITQRG